MKVKLILRWIFVIGMLVSAPVQAELWTYKSPYFGQGIFFTAEVDISFRGPGIYQLTSGLNSMQATAFMMFFGPSEDIFTLRSDSPSVDTFGGGTFELDETGTMISWLFMMQDVLTKNQLMSQSYTNVGIRFAEDAFWYSRLHISGSLMSQPGVWTHTQSSIPEPVSLALVGLGLFGIGASRRRKKQRVATYSPIAGECPDKNRKTD